MAWTPQEAMTLEEIEEQEAAILRQMSAPKEVHYRDRGLTNRDAADLQKTLDFLAREKAKLLGGQGQLLTTLASFTKG